jgi:cyanophycinase
MDRRQHAAPAVVPSPEETVIDPSAVEHTPEPVLAEEVGGSGASRVPTPVETSGAAPIGVGSLTEMPPPSAPVAAISSRGWLIPIGGRMEDPAIVNRFIELCGPDCRIVVIPTASNQAETGTWYQHVLRKHGARCVEVLRLQRRGDTVAPEQLEAVRGANGVFFTGGNQLKLAMHIVGTPLAAVLRERFAHGLHVAGTSAGASFLSAHMIAFGQEGAVPHAGMVITCGGLGLTDRYIIDQHFRERDRLGRLLTAVAYNPFLVGLGVDENTAVFISPDDELEVVGEGTVTIVDAAELDTTHVLEAMPGTKIELPGMKVLQRRSGANAEQEATSAAAPR